MLGTAAEARKARRRELTRREILDAAWQVARERGLGSLTLRQVGEQVGMRAPSLYSHFDSKNAIYDAMYAQAWTEYLRVRTEAADALPPEPRAALKAIARTFFDFAVDDVARYQLMNVRTLPDFVPTPRAYAPAVEVLDLLREQLARLGVRDQQGLDLFTALVAGLVDQHLANDPNGTRWSGLLERAMDMYATEMGLPGERTGR
jgi:AcrR family transcriptional regulator